VRLIAFDVDAQRRTGRSRARQAIDDARAVLEEDAYALPRRGRSIDRIMIGKVVGGSDGRTAEICSLQLRQVVAQAFDEVLGRRFLDLLVVMPRVEVAAVGPPMLADDLRYALPPLGQDVEPEQHGPYPVLLADVVGPGAGAFLAADRRQAGVEQIAEEL